MAGISNIDIKKFMKNETNANLKKIFKTVMSSDSLTKFVNFKKILKTEKAPYPFIIMNTSRHNKPRVHWWSFLNIDPKNELFLFDSESFEGFKFFIKSDELQIMIKYCAVSNISIKEKNKINLMTVQFSLLNYGKLKEGELKSLPTTSQDLLHLLAEFAEYNNVKDEMKLVLTYDELKEINTGTCWKFQLYFYKNLSYPLKNSKIQEQENFNKKKKKRKLY